MDKRAHQSMTLVGPCMSVVAHRVQWLSRPWDRAVDMGKCAKVSCLAYTEQEGRISRSAVASGLADALPGVPVATDWGMAPPRRPE